MAIDRTADLLSCLKASGVAVTSGAMSGYGVVRVATEELLSRLGVSYVGTKVVVTVAVSVFPTLATNHTIVVGGTSYKVAGLHKYGDGALMRVWCAVST